MEAAHNISVLKTFCGDRVLLKWTQDGSEIVKVFDLSRAGLAEIEHQDLPDEVLRVLVGYGWLEDAA